MRLPDNLGLPKLFSANIVSSGSGPQTVNIDISGPIIIYAIEVGGSAKWSAARVTVFSSPQGNRIRVFNKVMTPAPQDGCGATWQGQIFCTHRINAVFPPGTLNDTYSLQVYFREILD